MVKIDKKKSIQLFVSLIVTGIFLYLFEIYVGFEKFILLFKSLSLIHLVIGIVLYTFSYIIRSIRWSLTLDIKEFGKLFKITVFNTFFNIILPFRVGEISFFYMLKKEGISLTQTTMSFITTRIFDGLSLIGFFSLFYFLYKSNLILGVLTFFISPFIFIPISLLIKKIKHQEIVNYHSKLEVKNLLNIYILSVLTLIFKFSAFYFVLPPDIKLSISEAFLAFSAGDLTTVLPIHGIAGIGTYESGYAGSLLVLGVSRDIALLSALFTHTFILFSSSILAFLTYIFSKKL
ncbi:MAG: lysylphosphatidylglycerol synthase transmembrane domain-containing protein [Hydrogenothermaceae bacterium]